MNIEPEIVAAIISGSVAILATYLTNLFMRRKNDAQAADALASAVEKLINPLNARIDEQEAEIETLKTRLERFLAGIKKLTAQLRQKGYVPVWTPDMENK